MGYKHKKQGYRYRRIIGRGHSLTRNQREIIHTLVTRQVSGEEFYQLLTQLSLQSSQLDEVLEDLAGYDDRPDDTDTS